MDYQYAKKTLHDICKWGGSGDENEVKKILDEHPSLINEGLDFSSGSSVLILASKHNHIKVMKLLLLSYNSTNINQQNHDGWTALHCVSSNGNQEITELLLSHNNTDINKQNNDGWTALHHASYNGHKLITKLLLSYNNTEINKKNNDGWTALHCASSNGHKEVVELLLSRKNINSRIQNKDGKVASDICCDSPYANKSNKPMILELLKNHNRANVDRTSPKSKTSPKLSKKRPPAHSSQPIPDSLLIPQKSNDSGSVLLNGRFGLNANFGLTLIVFALLLALYMKMRRTRRHL